MNMTEGTGSYFHNQAFVRKLLESFVKETFIQELDYFTLKNADKEFIKEDHGKRESYTIDFRGSKINILLMIEFQFTPDTLRHKRSKKPAWRGPAGSV